MNYTNNPVHDAESYYNSQEEPREELCQCGNEKSTNEAYCQECIDRLIEHHSQSYFGYIMNSSDSFDKDFTSIEDYIADNEDHFIWFINNQL